MKIAVIGLGKLGAPLAAVLASAGHTVVGVDKNDEYVEAVNKKTAPVDETDLQITMYKIPDGQLTATTNYADAIPDADMSMIIVPTPSDENGRFSNEYVLEAIGEIGKNLGATPHTVVVCSTIMPGAMTGVIIPALREVAGDKLVEILYSPEFIALGSVIHDMRHPDAIFIGAASNEPAQKLVELVGSYAQTFPEIHIMTYGEAELAKIGVNTYVTMKISYANTIGELCEHLPEASASRVLDAIGADSRIGKKYLRSGAKFGGPCFVRDGRAFVAAATEFDASGILAFATDMVNQRVTERVIDAMSGHYAVAILGLSYKPGTNVTEESMGMAVVEHLAKLGVTVRVHDPEASPELPDGVEQFGTIGETMDGVSAVLIATPWEMYSSYDFAEKLVVDCWGISKKQANRRVLGEYCWWLDL